MTFKNLLLIGLLSLFFSQTLSAQSNLPNFNALFEGKPLSKNSRTRMVDSFANNPLVQKGKRVQMEEHLGVPTFLFASDQVVRPQQLRSSSRKQPQDSSSRKQQLEAAARSYVGQFSSLYRFKSNTLSEAEVKHIHDTGKGGIIVQFEQHVDGVEVFLSDMKVMMRQNLDLVALSGYLSPHETSSKQRVTSISSEKAVALAFQDMGGSIDQKSLTLSKSGSPYRFYHTKDFKSDYVLRRDVRVKDVWFTLQDRLVSGYYVELVAGFLDSQEMDAYSYVISAQDGSLLFRNNLKSHLGFTYDVYAAPEGNHMPFDGPRGTTVTPFPRSEIPEVADYTTLTEADFASFRPAGVEQNSITLTQGPISTNDPWLADNATETKGNNVDARDGTGQRAETTSLRTFAYPYSVEKEPQADQSQIKAGIVNLFYTINFLHDWYYDAGFDESAGNGQENNYGRGGEDGDGLIAIAQESSFTNNASMTTYPDGANPVMRLSLYDGNSTTTQDDSAMDNLVVAHEWGHYISNRLIGNANGLMTYQGRGLGEGWSDFHGLLLSVREEDTALPGNEQFQGTYSAAGFVTPTLYFSVRRAPYSTDFSWNALTFKHIEWGVALDVSHPLVGDKDGYKNADVHNTGSVWANMLWEVYAALLNRPDSTFVQTQQEMIEYLVAAYKMTPTSPTFTEARDALLGAIISNSLTDYQLSLQAFAKRGIGPNAVAPLRSSHVNQGVVEDFTESANVIFEGATFNGNWNYCDRDGVWDSGETALLEVTLKNLGAVALQNTTATISAPSGKVEFPNGGVLTFVPSNVGERVSASIEMTLSDNFSYDREESIVIHIDYGDSAMSRTPLTETMTLQTNYSLEPLPTAIDTVNETYTDWEFQSDVDEIWNMQNINGISVDPAIPDSSMDHQFGYYVENPLKISDMRMTSPVFTVGNPADLMVTFEHFHSFVFPDDDGGVVEMKVICCDAGEGTWRDINDWALSETPLMTPGYTGTIDSSSNVLSGRAGFIDRNLEFPAFITETIDLRNRLNARDKFQIRFRLGTGGRGVDDGWFIDNIEMQGLESIPFNRIVDDIGCPTVQTSIAGNGWHLLTPGEASSTEAILEGQNEIVSIWGWDGTAWQAKFRNAITPNPFADLAQLNENQGYWFNSEGEASISGVQGGLGHFNAFNLSSAQGWHLLGVGNAIDVLSFFAEALPAGATVWAWKDNNWEVYTTGDTGNTSQFNDAHGTQFPPLRTIEASKGFWVNLGESND